MVSIEWDVMRSPARAYARLASPDAPASVVSVVGRPIVAALLIGSTMATTATDVADAATVFRATVAWSFTVAIQVIAASVLVLSAPRRRVPALRAVDLLFAANGPWACWLIAFTLWIEVTTPLGRPLHMVMPTLVIPGAWTAWLIYRFCRVVLDDSPRSAVWRTGLHQAVMWSVGTAFFAWAVQAWPRLVAWWAWWQ